MIVTKLEAARRQINFSIELLYREEDPVCIQTLCAAGFGIVKDLASRRPGSVMSHIEQIIRPGMEKEFWGLVNKRSNFLKHADRDPDDQIEIPHETNDWTILLACWLYIDLDPKIPRPMSVHVALMHLGNPKLLKEQPAGFTIPELPTLIQGGRKARLEYGRLALSRPL